MTEEQAKDFCYKRQADVDRWSKKDSDGERNFVAVAYWLWIGQQRFRVFEVGNTLVEAVSKCQDKHEKIKEEHQANAKAK